MSSETTATTTTKGANNNANTQTASSTSSLTPKPIKTKDFETSLNNVFSKSNVLLLIWFLAIYLIIYYLILIVSGGVESSNQQLLASRVFDFIILLILLFGTGISFLNASNEEKETQIKKLFNNLKDYANDPLSLFSTGLFILVFYSVIFITGIPMTSDAKPITINIVETGAWIMLVITLITYVIKQIFNVSIATLLNKWLTGALDTLDGEKELDKPEKKIQPTTGDEVFNISNNLYTYDDAKTVCKSFGARLATYDEIESTYNKGGEWCNYGWSDNQMALFPTQKATWTKLQQDERTKNNCGRPGVNGGYMANPHIRYGVNCYGKKPAAKQSDLDLMNARKLQAFPKSKQDEMTDKKVQFWKEHSDKLLKLSAFNNDKWSAY
jgi:hypothetical protein